MNKSALRNFAVWARRDLIKRISDRANLLGVYEDKPTKEIQATTEKGFVVNGVTFNYKKEIRDAFVKRVQELGYQDAIEEIAYTWFNRIVALRFMEVNGYLTNGKNGEKIYVIGSTVDGKNEPDALTQADKLSFVDKFTVYDYQDANDNNGLYRYILTKQCNDLNKAMPLMFEEIEDYAELLLPDHLLDKGAIIDHLVNDISAKDFNITIKDDNGENASQVEIVGWLYQFYISEKKEDVFAGLKNNTKITKGTLPAATQIFTPDWIVRYMTDNTLGKMWVESRNSNLKKELKYYLEPAEQTDEVKAKLAEINKQYAEKRVTDITFIDPCCGSGHILVYAFDLFYKMYLESGYVSNEIPSLILKNNLVGIDVDKRAVQLTSFALTMKALSYDKDFLTKQVYPNVIDMKESNSLNQNEVKEFISLSRLSNEDEEVVEEVVEKFRDAELYGSLIKDFRYSPERYDVVLKYIQNNVDPDAIFNLVDRVAIINTKPLICDLLKEAIILSSKYDVVVTNPPYASTSGLDEKIIEFGKLFYCSSRYDLYAMFIDRCSCLTKENGLYSMITMKTWLFISRFLALREELISKNSFENILDLGQRAFGNEVGTIVQSSVIVNRQCKVYNFKTIAIDLQSGMNSDEKKQIFLGKKINIYFVNIDKLKVLQGFPFAYWISNQMLKIFENSTPLENFAPPKQGMTTSDNNRFLRLWHEVNNNKIGFNINSSQECISSLKKWFPYNKGGIFRKWYGNNEYIVNYYNNGQELEKFHEELNKTSSGGRLKNRDKYFLEAVSWPYITESSKFGARFIPEGFLFDVSGSSIFGSTENLKYLMSLMCSKISVEFMQIVNPTMNFQVENIKVIPVKIDKKDVILNFANKNIEYSKKDWDMEETSWDFEKNPLI